MTGKYGKPYKKPFIRAAPSNRFSMHHPTEKKLEKTEKPRIKHIQKTPLRPTKKNILVLICLKNINLFNKPLP